LVFLGRLYAFETERVGNTPLKRTLAGKYRRHGKKREKDVFERCCGFYRNGYKILRER
jgi:hypothetical protein